jgi:hypothetical protein
LNRTSRRKAWRGYRADDRCSEELSELAWNCPLCAEREFGQLWMDSPEIAE